MRKLSRQFHAGFRSLESVILYCLMDGLVALTTTSTGSAYLEARPHKLLMELDEQILLIFTEIATVRLEALELILTDFQQFVFDWQGYGDLLPHAAVYRQGTVKLVPPMGRQFSDAISPLTAKARS